jgi:hypothetical protein
VTATAPTFSAALRGYRQAHVSGDTATADALLAWLAGQPNVAAAAKRAAGVKGEIDHFGALNFLQGLLTVLRDSGGAGLLIVLDEVETIQRVRGDVRDKSHNALRQLLDEIDGGRFPGLYLLITGTPAFFDGPQEVQRLEPLAQRLHVDFRTEARFDNPRAVQVRLAAFDLGRLVQVGCRVRTIYQEHCPAAARVAERCDDAYVRDLASAVAGRLGGRVGIAPRVFLKKLVADVLDRIDQFPDFDRRQHYALTVAESELTAVERNAAAAKDVDDIDAPRHPDRRPRDRVGLPPADGPHRAKAGHGPQLPVPGHRRRPPAAGRRPDRAVVGRVRRAGRAAARAVPHPRPAADGPVLAGTRRGQA